MADPPIPVVPLNILYPNGRIEAVQMFIWDTDSAQPLLWDGNVSVTIGDITIGTVDQGIASTTQSWAVNLTKVGNATFILGQQVAADSLPVVLTAAQLTTLTPPAAITGFATAAKQDTGNTSLSNIDTKVATAAKQDIGNTSLSGIASFVSNLDVALSTRTKPSDQQHVIIDSGSVTTGGLTDTQLRATPVPVSGSVTATQATGTNLHTVVDSGTVTAVTDITNPVTVTQATAANLKATVTGTGSAGTAAAGVLTVQGIASMTKLLVTPDSVALPANQSVNISQINAVTPLMGAGNTGTGSPRVTIATDQVVLPVKTQPATSGGFTTFHLVSAGSTNATVVKNSAGQLFGWYIYNSNAAARKVAFHNASSTPTAGASIYFSLVLPPNAAANVMTETGMAFSTGIAITTVTGLADSDSTGVAANDLIINLWYA